MNTETDDDNLSHFSESVVEQEGVSQQTRLILPEVEDDAFFDMQLAILDEQQARERARQSATATAALPTVPKANEVRGQAIANFRCREARIVR